MSLSIAATNLRAAIAHEWIGTASISRNAEELNAYSGIWCVPASPYASFEGALTAIRFARLNLILFLGTCGGFQHAVIEYMRSMGHTAADHVESNPHAEMPVIAPLSCSLVEKDGLILIRSGTTLSTIYGSDRANEQYHCNYGINPEYASHFDGQVGLKAVAHDACGEVRAVELVGHPFFLATLYQPERAALQHSNHPLIHAFVTASLQQSRRS